ncbi:hypothetical protein OM337_22315, partial [Escherichia albertii]|nr:hypothetical protein [Escherichia albertii]MCZ8716382.1 hypothetical protein [Escherichia albertii]
HNPENSIHCNYRVGLISVAHQTNALADAQIVNKVRVVHAGCGINALSGLHNPENSIYRNYRVGLISVEHQANALADTQIVNKVRVA